MILSFLAVPAWLLAMNINLDLTLPAIIGAVLVVVYLFIDKQPKTKITHRKRQAVKTHRLLDHDRAGFVRHLRLDTKTVIFDGSNIYHYGRDKGHDEVPLGMLINQLRNEGYRIVCFFDANIYYTLSEHGAFPKSEDHSWALLQDIFGLEPLEIYVMPGGVQADQFILDALKYLPVSFAVTNDQYRDYTARYPTVMRDNRWRKGVVISTTEVQLLHHKLQKQLLLN